MQHLFNSREDWLASRKDWLGASEVASLFGYGYDSPYSLWLKKQGEYEEPESGVMRRGHYLESAVADWLEAEADVTLGDPHGEGMAVWRKGALQVTPDRLCLSPSVARPWPVEIKTDGRWGSAAEWREGIPFRHQLQAQAQMLAMDAPKCLIAGLTGMLTLEWRWLDAHKPTQDIIEREADRFMESVRAGKEPDVDGHEKTYEAMRQKHAKRASEGAVELTLECVLRLYDTRTFVDAWKERESEARNRIAKEMVGATRGTIGEETVIRWGKKFLPDWKAIGRIAKQQQQEGNEQ